MLLVILSLIMYFYFVKKKNQSSIGLKISNRDMCFLENATTHMILREKKYFSHLPMKRAYFNTISDSRKLIEGSDRVVLLLPEGTISAINNALYWSKSQKNLLSFKVLCQGKKIILSSFDYLGQRKN